MAKAKTSRTRRPAVQVDIEDKAGVGPTAPHPVVGGILALKSLRDAASGALEANPNLYPPVANTIGKLLRQLARTVPY